MPALIAKTRSPILAQRGMRKPARPVLDLAHPLSRGLIGCWLLGEETNAVGSLAKDIGPNHINGTIISNIIAAGFGPSHHGGQSFVASAFWGTSVSISTSPILKPPLPLSVSFWLYKSAIYSSTTNDAWFNNDDMFGPNNRSGISVADFGDGTVELDFADNTGLNRRTKAGTTVLAKQRWYHIVAVFRGATDMSIYVNGVDDGGSYSGTGGALAYGGHLAQIGLYGTTHNFDGYMEGFRFYNRGLTQSEVQWLYTKPYAGIYETQSFSRVGVTAQAQAQTLWAGSCM